MTLDEMYIETASYVDEAINKLNGEYVSDSLVKVNKFKSAINYAYKKICREKFPLQFKETINLGNNLTKKLNKVISIKAEGEEIPYTIEVGQIIFDYAGPVEVLYEYIPNDLENLTDVPELPEEKVDHKVLCYYAAFKFAMIDEDDDKANRWLSIWQDAYDSIRHNYKKQKRVVGVW
jgi:hypothetical protein